MEITIIIGYAAVILALVFGMSFTTDPIGFDFARVLNFIDGPSIFIVFGGVTFALLASFPLKYFMNVPKHLKMIISKDKTNMYEYVEILTELSKEARKKGLLALESKANEFDDPFLKESVLLIVDAIEPDKLKEWFDQKLDNIARQYDDERMLYDMGAALGPAMGMLGTLIGLVNMLKNMNFESGAESLGKDMSVALITTFYGSMLANVFFVPMGNKIKIAQEREMLRMEMIVEGVISIKQGENPKNIQEKLLNFLEEKEKPGDGGGKGKKGKDDSADG